MAGKRKYKRRFKRGLSKKVKTLSKVVRWLKPEIKYIDLIEQCNPDNSAWPEVKSDNPYFYGIGHTGAAVLPLNGVPNGNTESTRIGTKIRCIKVDVKVWARNATLATPGSHNICRFEVFLDKTPNVAVHPGWSILYADPTPIPNVATNNYYLRVLANRNHAYEKRFKSICSGTFDLDGGHGEYNNFDVSIPLNFISTFKEGTQTTKTYDTMQTNALSLWITPLHKTVPNGIYTFVVGRFYFTDI